MIKPPSFPFYVNNWLGSQRTRAMGAAQRGAYLELLCCQWNSSDQTVPGDDDALARLSGLNGEWGEKGAKVKACFLPCDVPGAIRNERLFAIWLAEQKFKERRSEAGREGMRKRWGEGQEAPPGFASFWKLWPDHKRKTNRVGCLAKWEARGLEAKSGQILVGLDAWNSSEKWAEEGGAYIEAPMVFLNQERWNDLEAARAKSGRRRIVVPPGGRRDEAKTSEQAGLASDGKPIMTKAEMEAAAQDALKLLGM